jgi:hypothetical protein
MSTARPPVSLCLCHTHTHTHTHRPPWPPLVSFPSHLCTCGKPDTKDGAKWAGPGENATAPRGSSHTSLAHPSIQTTNQNSTCTANPSPPPKMARAGHSSKSLSG